MKKDFKKKQTVLLVSDDAQVSQAEAETLRQSGYTVSTARSKNKALEIIGEKRADFVLIDNKLGKGRSAILTAEAILKKRDFPVIFLLEDTDKKMIAAAEKIESAGYVLKHLPPAVFAATITLSLSLHRMYRALQARQRESKLADREFRARLGELKKIRQELIRAQKEILAHEKSLKETEARFYKVFQGTSDAILVLDAQSGRILEANEAAEKLFSYPPEKLIGMRYEQLLPAEERESRIKEFRNKTTKGLLGLFRTYIVTADKRRIKAEISNSIIELASGPRLVQCIVRDITEAQLAEDTIKMSEVRYRSIAEHINDAYFIHDFKGNIFDCNENACKLLGFRRSELVGADLSKIDRPKKTSLMKVRMEELKKKGYLTFDGEMFRKDGMPIAIAVSARVVSMERDGLVQSFVRDIRERKQAEDALVKSEERFRLFMENFPGLAYIKDSDLRVIYLNKVFSDYLNLDPRQAVGKSNFELFPPDFAEKINIDDRAVLDSNQGKIIEEQFAGRVWETYKFTIEQKGGKPLLGGLTLDITARKLMEESLKNSEKKFETAFALSPEPMAISDLHTGVLIDFNNAFVKWSGFSREELIGHSAQELNIWVDPSARNRMAQSLREGKPFERELIRFRTRNNEIRDVYFSATLITIEDKEYVLSIDHDVTESRKAEEERQKLQAELIQAQKMESVGRLAGGMAHDFNNLLTVILGSCELLDEEKCLTDSAAAYACLKQIQKAGERAKGLTKQLLAFSRKQILEMKKTNLNAIVFEFEKILKRLLGEDITVSTILDPGLGLVFADASQIEQVIMNLAVNARDSMQDGGMLTIKTENADLAEKISQAKLDIKPGSYALLTISDTGSGMDEATQKHLFEPFFTTKEVGKGTGLGLAMVYGIIQQHNGYIWTYSEVGKGTTFKIYLPRVDKESAQAAIDALPNKDLKGKETVMVVEDEEMIRTMICSTLIAYGYTVIEALTASDAIRMASEATHIDLLLTDLIMPQMNGREVYEKIAKHMPALKVLYMSGYADDVISYHGILQEGIHFIQKPFLPSALALKLRQVFEEQK